MTNETPPPGWYPDASGARRWWDGAEWAEDLEEAPVRQRNSLGIVSLAIALFALIAASLSFPQVFTWVVSFISVGLAVGALCLRGRGRGSAIWGIIVAICAFLATFVLSTVT